jgi:2,5-diketo-D-gluconate reductase B
MDAHEPIPRLGIGTWKREGDEAYRTVQAALEIGYRHVDTAGAYGNEVFVGKAIADSGLKRAHIFVTTKVQPEYFGPGQVLPRVTKSLEDLRLDKVDLLLAHWPAIKDEYDINEYMAQFAAIKEMGLCDRVGVSNFTKRHLSETLRILGKDGVATNQVECHVLLQNRPIVDYTMQQGVPVTAYSPLAHGHLRESAGLIAIANSYGVSPEQIGLAFLLAEGYIIIPSSSKRERIQSNWDSQKINLSQDDIAAIRKLDEGRRTLTGSWVPAWDT